MDIDVPSLSGSSNRMRSTATTGLATQSSAPTTPAFSDHDDAAHATASQHAPSQEAQLDLSALPCSYLEQYPYPAFVLVTPIPLEASIDDAAAPFGLSDLPSFTRTTQHATHPFVPVWTNQKWRDLAQGVPLLDCISTKGARRLGDWVTGASQAQDRRIAAARATGVKLGIPASGTALRGEGTGKVDHAPPGFWEPEVPYEDRSQASDPLSASTDSASDQRDVLNPTLVLKLERPEPVTLELCKTRMPVFQRRRGEQIRMTTHTFTIVTTIPRKGHVVPDAPEVEQAAGIEAMHIADPLGTDKASQMTRPSGQSAPTGTRQQATRAEDEHHVDASTSALDSASGLPIIYGRDGSMTQRAPGSAETVDGLSLDVHILLRTTNWSATPLGPRSKWPQSLKSIVSLVMLYPHQCCLWWGPELTLIYNAQYADTIPKHPHIFGMSGPKAWSEIWSSLGPMSEIVLSGTPIFKEDDFLLFKQLPHQGQGTFEHYHSWMWVPVLQENGRFGGLWNATINTTKKVLAERRLGTVREMGERTAIARTMLEFDRAVIDILASNPKDVPFALLYHVETAAQKTEVARKASVTEDMLFPGIKTAVRLAGSVGVPDGHRCAPATVQATFRQRSRDTRLPTTAFTHTPVVTASINEAGFHRAYSPAIDESLMVPNSQSKLEAWPLEKALNSKVPTVVEDCADLVKDFPIRVWDELPNSAIVVPIYGDSDKELPSAVLVLGLSIRRPFDDDYESFIHVLKLQMASGLAAVRSYEAERQRIEDLAALDRAKSLLFSNVSHELRTPLTLVAGPLDDMIMDMPAGPKRASLEMARRNVTRLTRLVSALMDVSRLEAGKLKGSFRPVHLGQMTRDLAALFRAAIEKHKLAYIVECDTASIDVYVDPEHWEKIIFNLIGNALKYTLQGFVRVTLAHTATEAIFAVQDSGCGIPKSDIELVGERFHRVQSVSRSHEGTGIGLSLVKELVKLHGGHLEVESLSEQDVGPEGSHGSTFRVRIPLGREHLPDDLIELDARQDRPTNYGQGIVDEAMQWSKDRDSSDNSSDIGSAGASGESSGQSSRGIDPGTLYFKKDDVIMLVDDSHDVRRYMRSIFAPFCTVVDAENGREALELVSDRVPDLIITDVMMPIMDGYELLRRLKDGTPEQQIIPVIMLTARGGDEARADGLLAGADDYLAKPFNTRELIARAHMQIVIGRKRRVLENAFRERTSELSALSEHSPVGIFRCQPSGEVTYANATWYELSGYPLNQPVTNWGDYICDEHRESVRETWERFFVNDESESQAEWQWTNGKWAATKIIRLEKAVPGLRGILGCTTDISERKMHEELQRQRVSEAEQRRAEAEEAKRQQELLIDITSWVMRSSPILTGSHEIRNPISSLMQICTNLEALLELLQKAVDQHSSFVPTDQLITTINEDLDALESIYQCGLTQERISNDVLSLGRIQLDMLQMFDVETDLHGEASKVLQIFQNEARMKRIALSLKIGESVARLGVGSIKTDPVRLGQVITNLMSNAIRFTSNSHIRKIELRCDVSLHPPSDGTCAMPPQLDRPTALKEDTPVYLYVAVTDTGPGLTDKDLQILFQRFSQVSPKTHTVFGGSGLGLFVCRKITELMGGRIEVTSEFGKGSTFRFFIRARTCQVAKRALSHDSGVGLSLDKPFKKGRVTGFARSGVRPHVLIVEDNDLNRNVLKRQLKHVGLTCDVAVNGLEALEKVRKASSSSNPQGQPFDCILMDLEMPVMDGLTSVQHIREEEAAGLLSKNLVIALTGNARQGQIEEARRAGMDAVVIKPYRLDALLEKIEDMLKIRADNAGSQAVVQTP